MIQNAIRPEAERAARILGVRSSEGPEGLQAAYRAAVKQFHPDLVGGDADRLRLVIEAYGVLKAELRAGRWPQQPQHRQTQPPPRWEPGPSGPVQEISPIEALFGGRRLTQAADGRKLYVFLPAGLRAGDQVRVAGQLRHVRIASRDGLSVVGDHLCQAVQTEFTLLRHGGSLVVETPMGARTVQISRQDGARGVVRLAGLGLPPRADRPRGDLLLHLQAASAGAPRGTAQDPRRGFAAAWAA
jgi:curved DNA-binding protein